MYSASSCSCRTPCVVKRWCGGSIPSANLFDCEDDRDRGDVSISKDVEKVEIQKDIDEDIV